jgi:hypothetical protein
MPHKILDAPCTSQVTGLLLQPGSRVEAIRWHLAGTMASLEEAARAFQPDILISVYYRKIIPQAILDIPPKVTYPQRLGVGSADQAACCMRTHAHCTFRASAHTVLVLLSLHGTRMAVWTDLPTVRSIRPC